MPYFEVQMVRCNSQSAILLWEKQVWYTYELTPIVILTWRLKKSGLALDLEEALLLNEYSYIPQIERIRKSSDNSLKWHQSGVWRSSAPSELIASPDFAIGARILAALRPYNPGESQSKKKKYLPILDRPTIPGFFPPIFQSRLTLLKWITSQRENMDH